MSNRERNPGGKPETRKSAERIDVSKRPDGRYDITYYTPTSSNQTGDLLDAGLTATEVVETLGEEKAKLFGFTQKEDGSWTRK